jgi:hypothetical protein
VLGWNFKELHNINEQAFVNHNLDQISLKVQGRTKVHLRAEPLPVIVCQLKEKKMMKEKEKTIAIVKVIDPSKLKLVSKCILEFFQCLEMKPA